MLNLYKLEIFAAVVRAGSFSAAAEQLLLTQPAVSQHIQDLESSLGTRLFLRGQRGVLLTPAGEKLHGYTQAIFKLVAEAEDAVADVGNLEGARVTVGATPGVSVYLLPDWIQEFRSQYPRLSVVVQTEITPQIVARLRTGRLDLGLIEGELGDPVESFLAVQPLQTFDQLVTVGSHHPWWGRTHVAMRELDGQSFVMRQRGSQTRIWLDAMLQQYHVRPRVGGEYDNVESIKRAVMLGTGLTILPEYAVRTEVEMGRLHTLEIDGRPLQRTLKLVWNRDGYRSPAMRRFLALLGRHAQLAAALPEG